MLEYFPATTLPIISNVHELENSDSKRKKNALSKIKTFNFALYVPGCTSNLCFKIKLPFTSMIPCERRKRLFFIGKSRDDSPNLYEKDQKV